MISDPFASDFLLEKELNEGLSKKTVMTYETAFRLLMENDFVDLSDHSTYTERNFKLLFQYCLVSRKWTSMTYNRNLINVRVYCAYLVENGVLESNPLSKMKMRVVPKLIPKALDRDQVSQLLYAVNKVFPASDDYFSERNRAIVYFYLFTGLRLYELINLRVFDFDPSGDFFRVNDGKGGKDRVVPIISKLSPVLSRFSSVRQKNFPDTLHAFPSKYGNPIQHREVYNLIKKLRDKLPFHFTTHTFRHTFASELARKQVNLFNISRVL